MSIAEFWQQVFLTALASNPGRTRTAAATAADIADMAEKIFRGKLKTWAQETKNDSTIA